VFASKLRKTVHQTQRGLAASLRLRLSSQAENAYQDYAFRPTHSPVFQSPPQPEPAPYFSERHYVPPAPAPEPIYQRTAANFVAAPVVAAPAPVDVDDLPLANRMLAMSWQRRRQQLVVEINKSLPATSQVSAFSILPAAMFVGDVGRFLMLACDFYSHSFSNTLLLPLLPAGASVLNLPLLPNVTTDIQLSDAKLRVVQLRTRVANEHNRVAAAISRGDMSALFNQGNKAHDYKRELVSICRSVAINTIGLSGYVSHESHFNDILRKPDA
jgi:hypothetical protein